MVDWPTVALSASGSLAGILLAVLLERRREDMRQRETLYHRQDAIDQHVRQVEVDIATFPPAARFFSEWMERAYRRRGGNR